MNYGMTDIIYSIFVILILAIILFTGSKKEELVIGSSDNSQVLLSRLNNLRGIFALEIVIGHVIRFENTLLFPLGRFMFISVAFFFFVSAFGMVQSFHKKPDYLTGFFMPRAGYLIGLALVIYVINAGVDYFVPHSIGYYEQGKVVINFFALTNWYIWEQIFFYFVFWLIYKYVKNYRVLWIFVITFIGVTVLFFAGSKQGFYSSSFAFPLGLLYGEYYEKCQQILRSWKGKLIIVSATVLGLSSLLFGTESLVGMVYLKNIMCIAGVLILLWIVNHVSFTNPVLHFLGKYSVEIYLVQFIFLVWFEEMGIDYKIRVPMVVCATLAAAYALHPVFSAIKKTVRGC